MDADADEPRAFACPCAYPTALGDTYASVLALGGGSVQAAFDAAVAASSGAAHCTSGAGARRVTPPLGVSSVKAALDASIAASTGAMANTSSYCVKCRRITPSLNAARSVQENVIHWNRNHAYYVACAQFISTWPKQARGTRLRNRKKKQAAVDESDAG